MYLLLNLVSTIVPPRAILDATSGYFVNAEAARVPAERMMYCSLSECNHGTVALLVMEERSNWRCGGLSSI